jgi:hypothetical protein
VSRVLAAPVLVVAISVLAACSSSSSPSSSPTTSAPTSAAPISPSGSPASGSGSAATGQITTNWESFFDGKTAAAKKISLLQNGQAFASVINAQAGSALAKSAAAKVQSVSVNSTGTQATVKYNVLLGGQTALPNQSGTAIYQDGTWKVADSSFCALLALEGGGKAPQVCSSAG